MYWPITLSCNSMDYEGEIQKTPFELRAGEASNHFERGIWE